MLLVHIDLIFIFIQNARTKHTKPRVRFSYLSLFVYFYYIFLLFYFCTIIPQIFHVPFSSLLSLYHARIPRNILSTFNFELIYRLLSCLYRPVQLFSLICYERFNRWHETKFYIQRTIVFMQEFICVCNTIRK